MKQSSPGNELVLVGGEYEGTQKTHIDVHISLLSLAGPEHYKHETSGPFQYERQVFLILREHEIA